MIHLNQAMRHARTLAALWAAAALLLGAAHAATTSYQILLDTDNNASSGCSITLPGARGTFAGAELLLSTQVDTAESKVTSVTLQACSGGFMGSLSTVSPGGWPVGMGAGVNNTAVIETLLPMASLPPLPSGAIVRAAVMAQNDEGGDALNGGELLIRFSDPGPNTPTITPIPTLSPLLLALLTATLGLVGAWLARRHYSSLMALGLCVLLGTAGMAWAATIVLDGNADDWGGLSPALTGPKGDAPVNVDLVALWFTHDAQNAYFRIDADVMAPSPGTPFLRLGPIADRSIPAGQPMTLRMAANASAADAVVGYSLPQGPAGAGFAPEPLLTWTPGIGDVGTSHPFTVRASDGTLQAEASFRVTVTAPANRPPVIAQADAQIGVGATFRRTLSASDPDGDAVTVQLLDGPPAAQLTGDALVWPTTAGDLGEHVFTVSASDAQGATSGARFAVQVLPQAAPAANDDTYEVRQGEALTVPAAEGVLANDYPDDSSLEAQKTDDATAPDKGQLDAFGTDGSFTYTAPPTLAAPPPLKMALDWHADSSVFVTKTPSAADLNGDGITDVVYAGNNEIHARSGAAGQPLLWQHGQQIQLPAGMLLADGGTSDGTSIYRCSTSLEQDNILLLADVDDNDTVDVVTTVGCAMDAGAERARVIALDGKTGDVKWVSPRMTLGDTARSIPQHANLSVARLEPNGPPLIFGGRNFQGENECAYLNGGDLGQQYCRHVFALNGKTGALEKQFYDWAQVSWTGGSWYGAAPPLVADLTGDGQADVLFEGTLWSSDGTVLQQYDGTPELPGAPHFAVADLTGNGKAELLLLSRKGHLHALHTDGTPLWQTSRLSACQTPNACSLTVADVDGDGTPEILVHGLDTQKLLTVFDAVGRVRWTKRFIDAGGAGLLSRGAQPGVYDLDGDGVPEVILRVAQTIRILRGDTGEQLDSFSLRPDDPDQSGYMGGKYSPIIVGLGADDDGNHARIVVGNVSGYSGDGVRGIWALKSAHIDHPWMKARKRYGASLDLDGNVDAATGYVAEMPPTPGVGGAANLFGHQRQLETRADLRERARTSFAYQAVAEDGSRSAPATVQLNIVPPNRPPVITSTPPRVASSLVPFVYQVAAQDPDPGDTISYSASIEYGGPSLYNLTIDKDGLLKAQRNGDGMITVRATDSQGAWAEQSFFIEFVNPTVAANNIVTPNLSGQSAKNAMAQLATAGFNLGSLQEGQDDSVPAGQVMHQSPAGGSTQLKGTAVHLTISTGPAPRPVPAVLGKPLTQASTLLGAFAVGNVSHTYSTAVERGRIMTQTPAAGSQGLPPGPVDLVVSGGTGLELALSHAYTSADLPIAMTPRALAPDGTSQALPVLSYAITALATPFAGTVPTVAGSAGAWQINMGNATRGAFRITATGGGRTASADFAVGPPAVGGDSPMGEFVQLTQVLQGVADLLHQAEGKDPATAKVLVEDAVRLWRGLDRDALRLTSPMTVERGFLPTRADLAAAGVVPGPQDALLKQLLREGIAPLKDLTAGLRARHTPLTELDVLTAAFDAKARLITGLMPSEYGAVLAAPEYAVIVSHAIPDLMDALMDDLGEGVGLGRESRPFPQLKSAQQVGPKSLLVDALVTLAVDKAIEKVTPIIQAAKTYAKDILAQAAWGAAAVAAADHVKAAMDGRSFEAIVSGASMSVRVFESPWSFIEGIGIERDYPELNTVFVLGPDPFVAVKDTYTKIRSAAKFDPGDGQGAYKSAGEIKGDLKDLKANLEALVISAQSLAETAGKAFQSAVEPAGQCVFTTHPDCTQLMYSDGFASVYHYDAPVGGGGGLTGLPVPIIFVVYNTVTGQMFIDTPLFLPTPAN